MNTLEKVRAILSDYYVNHHDKFKLENDLVTAIDSAAMEMKDTICAIFEKVSTPVTTHSSLGSNPPPDQL